MSVYEKISGFADEISQDFDQQLKTVTDLGMKYICIRSAEHKGIADYTPEEVRTVLLPKLQDAGVGVSSLGTAIGKVAVDDEEGFAKQLEQLETLCETAKILDCSFIRMFSFLIPKDADADSYTDVVLDKLRQFIKIAEKHDMILLHENEKEIYGAMAPECRKLMDTFYGDHFKAIFDFANFVQCGQDTLEAYEMLKPYIAYIHVKDALKVDQSVVPAGYGDGNVEAILKDLFTSGFDGFLSLEPHLFDFSGFHALEKDGRSMAGKNRKALSGLEAFTVAYEALKKILDACSIEMV